jgi:putative membrane protein
MRSLLDFVAVECLSERVRSGSRNGVKSEILAGDAMQGQDVLWPILGFICWVGVVFLAVWVVMRLFPNIRRNERDTPRAILDRRYAEGEINREQYEEMLRRLER